MNLYRLSYYMSAAIHLIHHLDLTLIWDDLYQL